MHLIGAPGVAGQDFQMAGSGVCPCFCGADKVVSRTWASQELGEVTKASESCRRLDGWLGSMRRSGRNGPPLLMSCRGGIAVKEGRKNGEQGGRQEVVKGKVCVFSSQRAAILTLSIH